MSIWTSKAATVAAILALAACDGVGVGGGPIRPAPAEARVTSDLVAISGPSGFCVDPTATRDEGDTAFVLLGNCAAISNSRRAGQPSVPAVLTAAVSETGNGGQIAANLDALDGYFRSSDGLSVLSRSGDPDTVTILDSRAEGDAFFLHASDASDGAIDGVQDRYWRAYMDLGPRIVTLSVLALEDQSLTDDQSLRTLRAFSRSVRDANVAPPPAAIDTPPPVAADPIEAVTDIAPIGSSSLRNVGFLRRILG